MSILSWIVFGFIVGALAKWIVPGTAPAGILGDTIIGIAGGILGGWLNHFFGGAAGGFWNWQSWITAMIGAVVLLRAARVLYEKRGGSAGPTA